MVTNGGSGGRLLWSFIDINGSGVRWSTTTNNGSGGLQLCGVSPTLVVDQVDQSDSKTTCNTKTYDTEW
ncbi:hypothetical protein U1Q18_006294 [Sarracenia purpurea var. burkii]